MNGLRLFEPVLNPLEANARSWRNTAMVCWAWSYPRKPRASPVPNGSLSN